MTTVVNDTSTTAGSEPDILVPDAGEQDTGSTGTDLVAAPTVIVGQIVDGPVQLNTGQESQQLPFRAGILDARYLHEPQGFKRTQLGDLSDLVASVRLFGVRLPLVVRSLGFLPPTDADGEPIEDAEPVEHFAVVDGLRRRQAAIDAERFDLPCFIADTDDDIQLILQMLELNDHHKDLEPIEQAHAYQMLLDLGMSDQQVADARRMDVGQVRTAVKARTLPATAQRALNQGTLTLEQAHALEEFADDPDAERRLLDKLDNEYGFKHELSRLRDKRTYARNRELAKARLVLDSVDVTPKPRGFGYDSTAVPADLLVDADGQPVDIEAVRTEPGFHAFVEKDGGQARTVVYCDDPDARGYTRREPTPAAHHGLSPEHIAAKELEEQRAKELQERLELAAQVRHDFILATFGTAKGARALFVPALRTATLGKAMGRSADLEELYRSLGGSDNDTLQSAGEDRLRRSLVAKYICALEYNLLAATGSRRYWLDVEAAVGWYDELRRRKYPLTDDEQELYQSWKADLTPDDEDEDGEEQVEASVTAPDMDIPQDPGGGEHEANVDVPGSDGDTDAVAAEVSTFLDDFPTDDAGEAHHVDQPHHVDEFADAA
ncbi:ParB N-terminal domain-containing protein [Actinoplanes sp. NPDC049118]|uniref:ParB/RepB/Spo0J family partition protein n=1 Tax=Actinoplanes sp. NPDC049118 TaxID=3155769 RepID=UPI0033E1BDC7